MRSDGSALTRVRRIAVVLGDARPRARRDQQTPFSEYVPQSRLGRGVDLARLGSAGAGRSGPDCGSAAMPAGLSEPVSKRAGSDADSEVGSRQRRLLTQPTLASCPIGESDDRGGRRRHVELIAAECLASAMPARSLREAGGHDGTGSESSWRWGIRALVSLPAETRWARRVRPWAAPSRWPTDAAVSCVLRAAINSMTSLRSRPYRSCNLWMARSGSPTVQLSLLSRP